MNTSSSCATTDEGLAEGFERGLGLEIAETLVREDLDRGE